MPESKNPFLEREVEEALHWLRRGGTILYPTDTVWGIGCDARNGEAVSRIYTVKRRPDSKSLIILVADARDVLGLVAAPDPEALIFMEEAVRPTTVVFDGALGLPANLIADDGSIAIRVAGDTFCRHLIRRLGGPIVSTSANVSGEPTAPFFKDVSGPIRTGVDHIVKWRQDDETPAQPSMIVRWTGNGRYDVIRK